MPAHARRPLLPRSPAAGAGGAASPFLGSAFAAPHQPSLASSLSHASSLAFAEGPTQPPIYPSPSAGRSYSLPSQNPWSAAAPPGQGGGPWADPWADLVAGIVEAPGQGSSAPGQGHGLLAGSRQQ